MINIIVASFVFFVLGYFIRKREEPEIQEITDESPMLKFKFGGKTYVVWKGVFNKNNLLITTLDKNNPLASMLADCVTFNSDGKIIDVFPYCPCDE